LDRLDVLCEVEVGRRCAGQCHRNLSHRAATTLSGGLRKVVRVNDRQHRSFAIQHDDLFGLAL
jgi:hypothetical protein